MPEASGWRLKGCGELKRGLKNYQQGRAGTRVTSPCWLTLAWKQDGEKLECEPTKRKRENEKERGGGEEG